MKRVIVKSDEEYIELLKRENQNLGNLVRELQEERDVACGANAEYCDELETLRRDAERYRYLRESNPIGDGIPFIARNFGSAFSQWTCEHADKVIDAAIDAAMSKGEE